MNSSMLSTMAATAPSCARSVRGQEVGSMTGAYRANAAIFGAATGGFWTLDPHTTKQHHSLRERRT